MTNKALIDSFQALETQLGLRRKSDALPIFENESHRVAIELMDCHSTVSCRVTLKALPESSVDAYSIISLYDRQALEVFLRSVQRRTDEVIANFIAGEISGPCAEVFKIADTSAWMRLHQHHLQSLRRRNDVFWARVSGFDDGNDLSAQPAY